MAMNPVPCAGGICLGGGCSEPASRRSPQRWPRGLLVPIPTASCHLPPCSPVHLPAAMWGSALPTSHPRLGSGQEVSLFPRDPVTAGTDGWQREEVAAAARQGPHPAQRLQLGYGEARR